MTWKGKAGGGAGPLLAALGMVGIALGLLVGVLVFRTLMSKPVNLSMKPAPDVVAFDLDQAARRLGEAIRFETVSHQDPSQNDLAQWAGFHGWMAEAYPAFHAAAQRETVGDGGLVWTWTGRDPGLPPIVLMAHQDVVPASPETLADWKAPPFSGAILNGAVWGRGAIDDKGSLIAILEAGDALARTGIRPLRTIIVVSGHDEETRGSGAKAAADLLESRGVRAWFVLDEGSAIIKDHPVTQGPAALIAVAEKGYVTLRLTARAPGGHSSVPPRETAVSTLARAITAIEDKPWPLRYDGPTRDGMRALAPYTSFGARLVLANDWLFGGLLADRMGETPVGAAGLHTTIAPTMLQGSSKENVLPDTAIARINYRVAPGGSVAEVLARARQAVAGLPVVVEIEGEAREPVAASSTTSDAWTYLTTAIRAEVPGVPIAPSLMTAGSDSRYLVPVAQDVYRFAPSRFSLDDLDMIHSTNEHLTLDNLKRGIQFYARLMVGEGEGMR